jgi:hypothetical protein
MFQRPQLRGVEVSGMTREAQKSRERFFVEQAAKSLGLSWTIEEGREHPDFVICENGARFGVEVSEIFMSHEGAGPATNYFRSEYGSQVAVMIRANGSTFWPSGRPKSPEA